VATSRPSTIYDGKLSEVKILIPLLPEPGAFCVMDRGFRDVDGLCCFHQAGSFAVTRAKSDT
jgi:hypothetical protein